MIDGLEDGEDYRDFEAAIIADYEPETAIERELVLRLASLLWRLRRIIAIETDLFAIQGEILHDRRREAAIAHGEFTNQTQNAVTRREDDRLSCSDPPLSARELTCCFLRLGKLNNGAFERLGRYNAALWKQTAPPCFCWAPRDHLPGFNGGVVAVALDQCHLLQPPCRAEIR